MPRKKTKRPNNIPPGFTLRHTLRGHSDTINSLAWSPDGTLLASGSYDNTICLWDGQMGQHLQTLEGHSSVVSAVAWSPDGTLVASGSHDKTIRLWDGQTGQHLRTLKGHSSYANCLAWSPDGTLLASGSYDNTIRLWDGQTGQHLRTLKGHSEGITVIAWSPDGTLLASGSHDKTIRLWDGWTGQYLRTLEGHSEVVLSIAWSQDKTFLVSGSYDRTMRLWDPYKGKQINIFEEEIQAVDSLSFSYDGRFLASRVRNGTVRIRYKGNWDIVAILEGLDRGNSKKISIFHPHAPIIAIVGAYRKVIRIWDLDFPTLLKAASKSTSVHYTSAKIALVGEGGVGKSGLGYRIAENEFRVTESTHGQQFWVVDKLGKMRSDGTQCEAVLWDFAGQPNYRPIHALFLDDVDLALVLFDPSRQDTFTGVDYWLKQLSHKGQMCHTVLVAARTDVSKLSHSNAELEAFCREHSISGGFVATSAKLDQGIDTLLDIIREQIDWDAKPATITTETFKRIKDFVLALKADANRQNILVSRTQLRALLQETDADWQFSDAEMMTAVGHLQNHGYVTILRRSSDEESILLAPDVLINLAASFMQKAQDNEKGLGSLEEARALCNEYQFPEVERLSEDERDTLLNAVAELFLKRNVCFRESVDSQTFLIFPALIRERPPQLVEDKDIVEDMTYIVGGSVENVYAALVVLLGYSPFFRRVNQWSKQAQYETMRSEICGFKLAAEDPGKLELVLYYGKGVSNPTRLRFQGLFEEILQSRPVNIRQYPPVFCPKCGQLQERRTVIRRIDEGKPFLHCDDDGKKIPLPKIVERLALSEANRAIVIRDQILARMRTNYETALVRVKGFIRDRGTAHMPTCFVSYAWGVREQEKWVAQLADDLQNAAIDVVLDQWDNPAIGRSIARFISRIDRCDFILVVGTSSYLKKYENEVSKYGSVVAAEMDLISQRLLGTEEQKTSILPILLEGDEIDSLPPLLRRRVYSDFRREEYYFATLFDLVLTLHRIPFDHTIVRDLRELLRDEADELAEGRRRR